MKKLNANDLKEIASKAIKGGNEALKKGCFVTPDGQVFERDYRGLQYARGHAGKGVEVLEYDENGELLTPEDQVEKREELIKAIAESKKNKYKEPQLRNMGYEGLVKLSEDIDKELASKQAAGNPVDENIEDPEDNVVDLNKMKKNELIDTLFDLDPRETKKDLEKFTKDQLKALIVSANSLTDYEVEDLLELVAEFDNDDSILDDEITPEDLERALDKTELTALVLHLRDDEELGDELLDKIVTIEAAEENEEPEAPEGGEE